MHLHLCIDPRFRSFGSLRGERLLVAFVVRGIDLPGIVGIVEFGFRVRPRFSRRCDIMGIVR